MSTKYSSNREVGILHYLFNAEVWHLSATLKNKPYKRKIFVLFVVLLCVDNVTKVLQVVMGCPLDPPEFLFSPSVVPTSDFCDPSFLKVNCRH